MKSFSRITTCDNLRHKTENVIIIRDTENMIHSNYLFLFKLNLLGLEIRTIPKTQSNNKII